MNIDERRHIYSIVKELSNLKKQAEDFETIINNEKSYIIFTEKIRLIKDELKRLANL